MDEDEEDEDGEAGLFFLEPYSSFSCSSFLLSFLIQWLVQAGDLTPPCPRFHALTLKLGKGESDKNKRD